MLRWIIGMTREDRISCKCISSTKEVSSIADEMSENR